MATSKSTTAPAAKKPGATAKRGAAASKPIAKPSTKPAAAPKPAGAKKPSGANKADAAPNAKAKLVRDSFTFPKTEYAVLDALKDRGLSLARQVKKSELVRAGIGALKAMSDKDFLDALNAVPSLKTGRPKHA